VTSTGEVAQLSDAREDARFGAKATGLGTAARAGVSIPPGIALSGDIVDQIAAGDDEAIAEVLAAARDLPVPLAVRSSAVDEDGAEASFAGQHLTLLNVPTLADVPSAVRQIWWSANSDSAITYRQRVGLFTRPSVGVVVQSLLSPESAGVMFTTNPINGADERVVEAAWGLGEAVVAGRVIPDTFRFDRDGAVLETAPGLKKVAIRAAPDGGTYEEEVAAELREKPCLDEGQIGELAQLAARCEEAYGTGRDIEFAFANGRLHLLQCRAVTRTGGTSRPPTPPVDADTVDAIEKVPLFDGLSARDMAGVAAMFKERRFEQGETVTKEGSGAAAFYVIESGGATVTLGGREVASLGPGDYFGEVALIDDGARSATVTARGELVCHGLTYWEFRPLVQQNGTIAWNLLRTFSRRLRNAQAAHEPPP
jgi:pyruvate,water dikinase